MHMTTVLRPLLAAAVLAAAAVGIALLAEPQGYPSVASSAELNVRAFSPQGFAGGAVVPASCPSYAHTPGECTPPSFSGQGSGGGSGSGPGGTITINEGDSVTLSWSCPADYNTSSSGLAFSTGGALSGSTVTSPGDSVTYTVSCNDSGSSADVSVAVLHPTLSLSASPTRVRSGSASTITWSASGVASCAVTGPAGAFGSGMSGSQPTGPLANQSTYTLTCTTQGGTVSTSITITIAPSFEEI